MTLPAVTLSPYRVLDVSETATSDEIKVAYRRLALLFHPDRNDSEAATEMMRIVNLAYSAIVGQQAKPQRQHDPASTHYVGFRFLFGKYLGRTVEEVWRRDPGYLRWISANFDDGPTLDAVEEFLEAYEP